MGENTQTIGERLVEILSGGESSIKFLAAVLHVSERAVLNAVRDDRRFVVIGIVGDIGSFCVGLTSRCDGRYAQIFSEKGEL